VTDQWPITHRIEWRSGETPDVGGLPSSAGVLALRASGGEATFVGVSADVRAMARRRLIEPSQSEERTKRVDHARIARAAEAIATTTALEADAAFLETARRLAPGVLRAATGRWQGWFVHVNPETKFPRFTKQAIPSGGEGGGPPGTGALLGPARDKRAAQTLIETIEDGFDLCRYHHLLVQAPSASACAYKDMGRCPAPCDGSESMESYRARLREAVESIEGGVARARRVWESAMHARSAEMDFEGAARWKALLERTEALEGGAFRRVRSLDRFRFVAVGPGGRTGWARLHGVGAGVILRFGDVRGDEASSASAAAAMGVIGRMVEAGAAHALEGAGAERVGLACRHLFAPERKRPRQDVFVSLEEDDAEGALARAIGRMSLARKERAEATDAETALEIGGDSGSGGR
jgi:hypothetical protein